MEHRALPAVTRSQHRRRERGRGDLPDRGLALGDGGFIRWDGTRWRYLPRPPRTGLGTDLTGLAVISARDIWVVGTKGVTKTRALAEHWNSSKWTIVPTPNAING